jgi:hypothetical protein
VIPLSGMHSPRSSSALHYIATVRLVYGTETDGVRRMEREPS